jgi:hypothetical protein
MARLDAAGRPVLQYRNLGRADLYGAEGLARYEFNAHFTVRGLICQPFLPPAPGADRGWKLFR